jgi:hypothetical protein
METSAVALNAGDAIGGILDGYLTPQQLAAELGVSERTVARWHAARQGPPRVMIGRKPYYKRTSVTERWLASREDGFAGDKPKSAPRRRTARG